MADQLMSANVQGAGTSAGAFMVVYNLAAVVQGDALVLSTLSAAQARPFMEANVQGAAVVSAALTAYTPSQGAGRRQTVRLGGKITWEDNP